MKKEYAYYPFLDAVKDAVRKDMLDDEFDERIVQLAKKRVLNAIKYHHVQYSTYSSNSDSSILDDIKTYALSRIIISLLNRKIDSFAKAESMRALELCRKNGDYEYLMKELGLELSEGLCMPLNQFLKLNTGFASMKLSNRIVYDGKVKIEPYEKDVILREAIKRKVLVGLPIRESLIGDSIKKILIPVVNEIASEIRQSSPSFGQMSKDIAPCMENIMKELQSGNKVSHLKRWSLAVFLVKRGWDASRISNAFSSSPNFDEKVTSYQIQHIKQKGYSMPSCRTLRSQGICTANCGIKNPLQYRKVKGEQQS